MSKEPGKCIFCEKGDLSKEHIFPKWIRRIVRQDNSRTQARNKVRYVDGERVLIGTPKEFQGDVTTKKIYAVCRKCNGIWMSAIVNAAKPTMLKLINGEKAEINREDQIAVARLMTLTAITSEWTNPINRTIKQTTRTYVMDKKEPPPNWYIGIGNFVGEADRPVNYNRNWFPNLNWYDENDTLVRSEKIAIANTDFSEFQTVTFIIGKMYVHVVIWRKEEMERITMGHLPFLIPIWPISIPVVKWPTATALDNEWAVRMSNKLIDEFTLGLQRAADKVREGRK